MNTLHRTLAIAAVALSTSGAAADIVLQIYCEDCRDSSYSVDYGNFAFNQTYGENSWVLQDELIIVNPDGAWVHVDLSFILEDNILANFGEFIGIDLGIPTGNILIETTTDATETDSYDVDLDMVDTMGPLPVGDSDSDDPPPGDSAPPSTGGGDSSGGNTSSGDGVGAGPGSGSGGAGPGSSGGGGGGLACTSAGDGEWHCVAN